MNDRTIATLKKQYDMYMDWDEKKKLSVNVTSH